MKIASPKMISQPCGSGTSPDLFGWRLPCTGCMSACRFPRLRSFASNPKKWQDPTAQTAAALAKAESSAWHIASQRELCTAPVATTEPPNKPSLCLCGRVKPSFGWPQDVNPSCCGTCKAEGMVRLRGRKCRCGGACPVFGMLGDARPTCCSKCKVEGMVDIKNSKCQCGKARPSFGFANDARPSCCSECKVEGMVNINNKRCRCGRAQPLFGFLGALLPSCCSQSKDPGMVNIRNQRCKCGKAQPFFGFAADTRPSCCSKCKTDGMLDIRNRRCQKHAAEVRAHVLSLPGRSRIASELLDALEQELEFKFSFRFRFDAETCGWSGEEFVGLVSNRRLVPDAYDPEGGIIVEFLGNFYHGFPPEHPRQLG